MSNENDFLVWLDAWIKEQLEDIDPPDFSNCSTSQKGIKKGMYEEKLFIGRTLRHRINVEKKRLENEEKWKKEMNANGEMGD